MRCALTAVMAMALAGSASGDVSLTVYNQNLGLVTEARAFALQEGMHSVTMTDVAAQIEPTSVRITFAAPDIEVYEQNYHYDLVNTQAILNRYLDKPVRLAGKAGDVYEGTLLSAAGGMYVLQTGAGLKMINASEVVQVDLERLPDGFYTRPTLEWLVGASRPGDREAEISYLTRGIRWHAEYVAHLNADDTRVDLSGWASIDNQSGATYRDASLKLIAGDIHRAPERGRDLFTGAVALEYAAAPKAGFEERAFFEYHLYDLPRRTTVADKETKQIALFEPATASVLKKYKYRPYRDQAKVAVVVELENREANGLGMPLPAGLVRLTKSDIDGSEQLLGEDRIDHTPRDEDLSLEVGNAFDLTAEYRQTDRRAITRRVSESDFEIKLRNHKTEAVEIEVEQKASRWTPWQLTQSSHPFEKIDADTFVFKIRVPVDLEVVLTYTLRTGA